MQTGEKIKSLRLSKNLTRAELARQANMPLRTLEDWEYLKRVPSRVDYLLRISEVLGVTVDELCKP